jgi:hypothetical protein
MKTKIIGLMGQAGSGKDTFADKLVENHRAVKVALADPMKRFCREVYQFSYDQLWGPSHFRNAPDGRYSRGNGWICNKCFDEFRHQEAKTLGPVNKVDCFYCGKEIPLDHGANYVDVFLTPRYALQLLGTEWGRHCHKDTWINYALRVAHQIPSDERARTHATYSGHAGLDWSTVSPNYSCVIIPDCRFQNEVDAIQRAGGIVIQVLRKGKDGAISGGAKGHASEEEQKSVKNVNIVLHAEEGLDQYYKQIEGFASMFL